MDVGLGTRGRRKFLTQWRWSNPSVKDIFAELTGGLIGRWSLPSPDLETGDIADTTVRRLAPDFRAA